ncbi:MAG: protein kinase [Anaeromyxobacter sp.]
MTDKTLHIADEEPKTDPDGEPVPGKFGAGDVLEGRYRLDVLLGEGGMGTVWRADHLRIHKAVAVKLLHPEISHSPLETERFRREAQIAVRLKSPYVVDVLDFGQTTKSGALYLVMELLEGESLKERVRREGRIVPEEVGRLLRQLMRGLDAAHRAGIVHRDLKPENLWLVPDDGRLRLKILDFGIAKVSGPMGGTERTQAGLVMGTPQYLSPEQAVGGDVDHRADLYSAGIIAYLMLTGRHPFPTNDARGLLRAHAFDPVPSPARELPELVAHPALLRFVNRACEKDRNLRAQSAAELLEVLEGRPGGAARKTQSGPVIPLQRTPSQSTSISGLLRPVSSSAPRALNLTLLLTEIADWGTLQKTRGKEEVAGLLTEHDHLVLPAIRAYHGRRIKSKDETLVAAFPSPTNAVLCAMAIQDRLAARNVPGAGDRLALKVAVHLGETREEKGDLVGEPLAVGGAVRRLTEPGEIRVTRSVYLSMSRGEVHLEALPPLELGQGQESLPLYRVERQAGPWPYGGREAERVEASEKVTRAIAPLADGLSSIGDAAAEGRVRATFRVAWAATAIGGLRLVDLALLGTQGLLLAVRFFGWSHRTPPLWLERGLFGVGRAREATRARVPVHRAALIRPLS